MYELKVWLYLSMFSVAGILRAPNPRGGRGAKVESPWGSGVGLGSPKIPAGMSQKFYL